MWSSGPWGPAPRSVASVVNRSLGPPVVSGQSSSTTGWRVWRQSMPPVGSDEAGVPTFSPIVKWSVVALDARRVARPRRARGA